MNFLSHYYLQAKKNDNYYTVGTTLPDLLSLYGNPVGITIKKVEILINEFSLSSAATKSSETISLARGISAHLRADLQFHKSLWFKESIDHSRNLYYDQFNSHITESFHHILIEILLDHQLVTNNSKIVEDFYHSYEQFNINCAYPLFSRFTNYQHKTFEHSFERFLKLRYIENYNTYPGITLTMFNICKRLGIKVTITSEQLEYFVSKLYVHSKQRYSDFFKLVKMGEKRN